MKKLKNKVAIITGGAGALGYATAKEIAQHGAKVMLVDINESQLKEKVKESENDGISMMYAVADVTQSDQVKAYVNKTLEAYGKIDLFFNNAGIEGKSNLTKDYSEEVFDSVIKVNVKGVFLGLKYVIPAIEKGGSIVITSSIAGLTALDDGMIAYHASKHAVRGMVQNVAKELAAQGIRVNTVHPGIVDSPMVKNIEEMLGYGKENDENNNGNTQSRGTMKDMIPLKRYAQPKDISKMVAYLFSDDASYITGSKFVVDGGVVG